MVNATESSISHDRSLSQTDRIREIFDKNAAKYDKSISFFERLLFGGGREWVCAQAQGEVLEIAVGTGRNLPFYPRGVRIKGIELSPEMLRIARERASSLEISAELSEGDAQALPFPDRSFDTVVCTLALCSIPDDRKAISEARRVLRPGGKLLLLEHVRSPSRIVRGIQHLLDMITVRLEGDHQVREPLDYLTEAGFHIERVERSKLGIVERVKAVARD